jgi:hypothetical protein
MAFLILEAGTSRQCIALRSVNFLRQCRSARSRVEPGFHRVSDRGVSLLSLAEPGLVGGGTICVSRIGYPTIEFRVRSAKGLRPSHSARKTCGGIGFLRKLLRQLIFCTTEKGAQDGREESGSRVYGIRLR